ncbi:hypothetical protein KSX_71640 [Ktedonospora formicarum]|uniref:Uncharacterized protein n=1 Tax=Ktedonospora formicarum TaxID=2778364 RepID=A0A8J3MWH7_9CHLR|nr:hypothetical protein KSX_71640 [Ktedonospora formicarum]
MLRTPLLGIERVASRTEPHSIGLRSERGAGKAPSKGRMCPLGRDIDDCRHGLLRWLRLVGRERLNLKGWSQFGRAQFGWREMLSQLCWFQSLRWEKAYLDW